VTDRGLKIKSKKNKYKNKKFINLKKLNKKIKSASSNPIKFQS
jgi:hypothetical protein